MNKLLGQDSNPTDDEGSRVSGGISAGCGCLRFLGCQGPRIIHHWCDKVERGNDGIIGHLQLNSCIFRLKMEWKGGFGMQDENLKLRDLEEMIAAIVGYYDRAGIEDFYEKELKGKSEKIIREIYRKIFETDDETRIDEETRIEEE